MKYLNLLSVLIVAILSVVCGTYGATYEIDEPDAPARPKRDHGHGITGPVHTFVKTDKHANFKWGVRHHVGHQYAGRK